LKYSSIDKIELEKRKSSMDLIDEYLEYGMKPINKRKTSSKQKN
jgi:hypothetical protein